MCDVLHVIFVAMHRNQNFTDIGGNVVPDSSGMWTSIKESLVVVEELRMKTFWKARHSPAVRAHLGH